MAIIGKIRSYSGLLIAIIGIALAAFVLGDFWNSGNSRAKIKDFGEINGETIKYEMFDKLVNEQVENYLQRNNLANISPDEIFEIRQSVWDQIVKDQIMLEEYKALGLAVQHSKSSMPSISPEELSELIIGDNPHPYIFQNFIDPRTGMYDKQRVRSIVENFENMEPKDQIAWVALEKAIKDERLSSKYKTLVSQSYYVPTPFAKREFQERNTIAKIRLTASNYKSISDSLAVPSEEDYKNYYNEHKKEFQQDKSRDIAYVIFDIVPSIEDRANIDSAVAKIYKEFSTIGSDELINYVRRNSEEGTYDSAFYKKGTLSIQIDSIIFKSSIGTVTEPYIENNVYYIHRLVDKQNRPDSMRASHIFITYKGAGRADQNVVRTKVEAQNLADSLLSVIKKDTSAFSSLARTFSDDASAKENGGDLGWLPDGHLIKELNDACINSKIGDVVLVKSTFGMHILKVKDKKVPVEKVQVATITKNIVASEKTIDKIYAQAAEFATEATSAEEFDRVVIEKKLNKRTAQYVQEMSNKLPGVESAREVIQWLFADETEKGETSGQIFNCETKYVVAAVTDVREKGIATLEQVKTYIDPLVRREKKAQMLTEKMSAAMAGVNDLNIIASKLSLKVDTINNLTFSTYNLPGLGPEPKIIGTVFTLKTGLISKPIKGDQGVYAIIVDEIQPAADETDFSPWKAQATGFFKSRLSNPQSDEIYDALKRKADITDNRRYYY